MQYWATAFQHRSYVNVTHLSEFVDIMVTAVTAPLVESARGLYQRHVKELVRRGLAEVTPVFQKHVQPLYEKHVQPLYEKHVHPTYENHLAPICNKLVAAAENAVFPLLGELWQALRMVWSRAMEHIVDTTESSCNAALEFITDDSKRAKVQPLCDDAEPFVVTVLSIPLLLLFCRLALWLLLLPFKLLLLLSPVRFN
jgi:hypothetical protein